MEISIIKTIFQIYYAIKWNLPRSPSLCGTRSSSNRQTRVTCSACKLSWCRKSRYDNTINFLDIYFYFCLIMCCVHIWWSKNISGDGNASSNSYSFQSSLDFCNSSFDWKEVSYWVQARYEQDNVRYYLFSSRWIMSIFPCMNCFFVNCASLFVAISCTPLQLLYIFPKWAQQSKQWGC